MPTPLPARLHDLRAYLDGLVDRFERPSFIAPDPISIPHGFDDPEDRAIIGLYAALLAWGQRPTMLRKLNELCERMQYRPAAFVQGYRPSRDAERLDGFKHRTFQPTDAHWLTRALSEGLRQHGSVERLFARHLPATATDVGPAIQGFSATLLTFVPGTPARLRKHLAQPDRGSACKRLAMYLRWMVRPGPVDFGLWTSIRPAQLVLPLDVHAGRQARALGFLHRSQNDWRAVQELTEACRRLDPTDPARYDFAFYGAGAHGVELDPAWTGQNRLAVTSAPTVR
ncbi:MAG: TIGR02757 family protein [Bacteroidota bacterium]